MREPARVLVADVPRRRVVSHWWIAVIGAALAASACAGDFKSCEERGDCEGSAGNSGSAGTGSGGQGGGEDCDETESPRSEPCRLRDESAVFVSPLGDDAAAGTRDAPIKTLSEAIRRAAEVGKSVAACAGTYDENVAVSGEPGGGVEVYGGFACDAGWARPAAGERSLVQPVAGAALTVDSVSVPVRIEGFELRAADATLPGASSIAAMVRGSSDVTFRDVKIVAGRGADGAPGDASEYMFPDPEALRGKRASATYGALACAVTCPGASFPRGGAGGDSDATTAPVTAGEAGTPKPSGARQEGRGGLPGGPCDGEGTGRGADGASGPLGELGDGAMSVGSLRDAGWAPASGSAGLDGAPGQGGGGGRGGPQSGGGGGGCGGCGGRGGGGGQGGGGSIALLVDRSLVTLEAAEIVTSQAGNGGDGAAGQPGQPGGPAGEAYNTSACDGGAGGDGAAGGVGGGGAGGISVGILYSGTEPAQTAGVQFSLGEAGMPGAGDASGENQGAEGVRERTFRSP